MDSPRGLDYARMYALREMMIHELIERHFYAYSRIFVDSPRFHYLFRS